MLINYLKSLFITVVASDLCVMSSVASADEVLGDCFVACVLLVCGNVSYLALSKLNWTVSINTCTKWQEFHSYRRRRHLRGELIFHSNNITSCAGALTQVIIITTERIHSDSFIPFRIPVTYCSEKLNDINLNSIQFVILLFWLYQLIILFRVWILGWYHWLYLSFSVSLSLWLKKHCDHTTVLAGG